MGGAAVGTTLLDTRSTEASAQSNASLVILDVQPGSDRRNGYGDRSLDSPDVPFRGDYFRFRG